MQIDLDEAVSYLREVLVMRKPELLRETGHLCDQAKTTELIAFVFERKFNQRARPPVVTKRGTYSRLAFGKRAQ